jgi:PAS domain S-box-containing protein
MTDSGHKPAAATDDELRRTVAMLLSTQQTLIDLRHRRDRELRVLDVIVRFSERVLPDQAGTPFWDSVADAATETFECEICIVAALRGGETAALAARGPRLRGQEEITQLRVLIERGLADGGSFVDGDSAAQARVGGEALALAMIAPIQVAADGTRHVLIAAVTARKHAFFPQFDRLTVPGLRMFANHVHVLHEMLLSRQRIAQQLEELDASHHALEEANASLQKRIAEQHRAEAALRESEGRYRHLFEDSADGLVLIEVATQQVSDCNDTLCRMTGKSRSELIGQTLESLLVQSEESAVADPATAQDRREGDLLVREVEVLAKDGLRVPVEIRTSTVQIGGREFRVCAFRDVSFRRRAEEEQEKLRGQLMQAQKMESIGRLAGGVAHDFNNLLTVICGYSEMLHGQPNLDPHQRDQIGEIINASRRAQALTQQLLMFSRKQVIRATATDMNRQTESSLRIYRRLIGEDIVLTFQPCTEPTPILADKQQLDQVLGNLVINARDAIYACKPPAKQREIRITTTVVPRAPGLTSKAGFVRLTVQDSGVGMDANTQANIFEPFFTTKDVGKGTGLGLATVFGVIQQNGGAIEVASEVGAGSTFAVYWPINRERVMEAVAAAPAAKAAGGNEEVLLVEDEQRVREFAVQGLREFGYRVVSADGPAKALSLLQTGAINPAILVTDVVMPDMNGGELAEAVLRMRPELPVLFVSGYTDDIAAQHGIMRESASFLEKPFSTANMARKIRDLIDAKRARH